MHSRTEDFRNQRITLAGLGKFGGQIAAARWLAEQGAHVLITDQTSPDKLKPSIDQLKDLPITWRVGEHRVEDFTNTDLVVASPAIPPTNRYIREARAAGVKVTSEIVLFAERCPAKVVAITGTKGKSTTTALLGEMLKTRYTTHVGGNIGRSLLAELPTISRDDVVVLELSSFMLHYLREISWSPHVAVVTMLANDHLDWHGSPESYLAAKRAIVEFQKPSDFAVLNEGCPVCREFAKTTQAKIIWFGTRDRQPFDMALPGAHNQVNAQAAFAAASTLGITRDAANAITKTFQGLAHRLSLVHESDGVRFYNDSIATIPQAAVAALEAFPPHTVIQIVGGSDKPGLDYPAMCRALSRRAKAILCIGATGDSLAKMLEETGAPNVHRCGKLERAVQTAKRLAKPGDVVLLSTGYASYDQFSNFEERGNAFAEFARQPS